MGYLAEDSWLFSLVFSIADPNEDTFFTSYESHKNVQGRNLACLTNHYVTMVIKKKRRVREKKGKKPKNSKTISFLVEYYHLFPKSLDLPW